MLKLNIIQIPNTKISPENSPLQVLTSVGESSLNLDEKFIPVIYNELPVYRKRCQLDNTYLNRHLLLYIQQD